MTLVLCSMAMAQAGQLDITFGNGGIFVLPGANSAATAVAIQSDGKILVAGQTSTQTGIPGAGVLRLTPNGTLDASFGQGGVANVLFSHGGGELATGVAIQSDGKIVLGIATHNADGAPALMIARLNGNGSFDNSFGHAGILKLLVAGPDSSALALQPDGKILLGGGLLLVRVNPDGSLDSGFGKGGFAPLVTGPGKITVQPNGQILVGAARYNANGSLDTSFGILGRPASLLGTLPSSSRLQSDGKIATVGGVTSKVLVAQLPSLTIDTGFGLLRYNPNGSIDTRFGKKGGVITDFSSVAPITTPSDMAIQLNGDIVVAGQAAQPAVAPFDTNPPSVFALARYTSTGQLDTTFGSGGKVTTSFGKDTTAGIAAMTLDSNGKIVAAGNSGAVATGNPSAVTVARYLTQ
jgi:uncharacterized delta-60 repeat protein